ERIEVHRVVPGDVRALLTQHAVGVRRRTLRAAPGHDRDRGARVVGLVRPVLEQLQLVEAALGLLHVHARQVRRVALVIVLGAVRDVGAGATRDGEGSRAVAGVTQVPLLAGRDNTTLDDDLAR